jgi:hypothetical protein
MMPLFSRKSSAERRSAKTENACAADASVMKESTRRTFVMKESRCRIFCQKEFAGNMVSLLQHIRLAEINFFSATLIDPLSLRRGDIDLFP